jgi:hypothetical protein
MLAAMPVLCSCASRNIVQAQSGAAMQSTFTAPRGAIKVELKRVGQGHHLLRDGKLFFIKGAGGDGSKTLLKQMGANSFRTWGADNLEAQLDEAHRLGLAVTVGIWLGHERHGFNYNNADQVAEQKEKARQAILRYKDHPAVLMWGIGNEMEGFGDGGNAAIWMAVNDIARMAKTLDPNHPTMTVVAEVGGERVKNIHRLCPEIDIVGINSYAGAPSIPERYQKAGGTKPYVITEFGPPGTWEVGKNEWNVTPEPTSLEKAASYRKAYQDAIANQPLCLGSYAFTWGNKQEATATWFGLLLPDGTRLNATDALAELWSGKPPANLTPKIAPLKVNGNAQVGPEAVVNVALDVSDAEGDPLKVEWILQREADKLGTGGDAEAKPPVYPEAIVKAGIKGAQVRMPRFAGNYRLFAFVRDGKGGGAVANVPLRVLGGETEKTEAKGRAAQIPFAVYDEAGKEATYIPSGYMGNTAAIKIDENWTTKPHSGASCIRVEYNAADQWGGVVWQSPANDWGDADGGWNLTGAKKLSFWVRGDKGGEKVSFEFGLLGRDKKYFDTGKGKLADVILTPEWKQYSIDVAGQDLARIKTGFVWTLAGQGAPVVFYLDDIRYE